MTTRLTQAIARLLLAPSLVVAAAILVKGYSSVGDGFSAGVVAALGVSCQYLAFGRREADRLLLARLAPLGAMAGLALTLAVTFSALARGKPLLTHAPPPGADVVHLGTLELVTALAFDVGVFLLVFGAIVGILRTVALARAEDVT
ncbi:MAG: MnhB domain-containing protein [Thermoleophilia bacterium]|nr:MnhB domain-containing protein [Thermoleophilia bacterium]